jgi:hypothetical protein
MQLIYYAADERPQPRGKRARGHLVKCLLAEWTEHTRPVLCRACACALHVAGVLDLRTVVVVRVPKDAPPNVLEIITNSRQWFIACDSEDEAQVWHSSPLCVCVC